MVSSMEENQYKRNPAKEVKVLRFQDFLMLWMECVLKREEYLSWLPTTKISLTLLCWDQAVLTDALNLGMLRKASLLDYSRSSSQSLLQNSSSNSLTSSLRTKLEWLNFKVTSLHIEVSLNKRFKMQSHCWNLSFKWKICVSANGCVV